MKDTARRAPSAPARSEKAVPRARWKRVIVAHSPRGTRSRVEGVSYCVRKLPCCVTCNAALNSSNTGVQCWQCGVNRPLTPIDQERLKGKIQACLLAVAARDGKPVSKLAVDKGEDNLACL